MGEQEWERGRNAALQLVLTWLVILEGRLSSLLKINAWS